MQVSNSAKLLSLMWRNLAELAGKVVRSFEGIKIVVFQHLCGMYMEAARLATDMQTGMPAAGRS